MRRAKKILKIAAIVVGALIALGLIGNAVWIHVTGSAVEQRLAGLRAEGQPLSMADLARKPIPSGSNAATYLRRAKDQLDAVGKEVAEPFSDEYGGSDRLLAPKDAVKIRAVYAAYPQLILLLEQAADCPDYESQLDFTRSTEMIMNDLIESAQFMRKVGRALLYHAVLLASEGKHDAALQDGLTLLKLAHHFDREPTLINYLVCCAIRGVAVQQVNLVLRTGTITPASRRALDSELARLEGTELLKNAFRDERAVGLSVVRDIVFAQTYQNALDTERAIGISEFHDSIPWGGNWLTRGMGNREVSYYLDFMSREIAAADQPFWEYSSPAVSKTHVLTDELIPAVMATRAAEARVRAQLRCLRVLNALQALPESEQGQEPKLSDLHLPREATIDPFTGNELLVKRLPVGWLVYSVGRNLKDDGGALADDSDTGVGPLPTPDERKKPANDGQE
jgi:hypothetical protein